MATKKTEHKTITMPPEDKDLVLEQKNIVDRNIATMIDNASNFETYDSAGDVDRELVRFELTPSSNERLQDPLPLKINGMPFPIPRGVDLELPRFVVAAAENHYVPIYLNKTNPYTNSRKKRKVMDRIYESVRLKPNKTTGMVNKIDIDRQEALAEYITAWRQKQLLKQA